MLDALKKAVFASYNPEEHKGVFLSGFAENKELVFSHGVLHTEQPLRSSLESLYTAFVEKELKKIRYIVCDIVTEVIEITNPTDILAMSPQEYWFAAVDTTDDISGVLLPNTSGVVDAKSALYDLKKNIVSMVKLRYLHLGQRGWWWRNNAEECPISNSQVSEWMSKYWVICWLFIRYRW